MRREDWTVPAMIAEAADLMALLAYLALQIVYGVFYHVQTYKIVINVFASVLIYAGLTLLALYPEKLNSIPEEACTGAVRKYSLRMLRVIKFIFVITLLIPSVCDVFAITLSPLYSILVTALLIAVAAYCEIRIIRILRDGDGKK